MKIKYRSNNSGGGWWLKDKDWLALKKAGWRLEDYEYACKYVREREKAGDKPLYDPRRMWSEDKKGVYRYLGAVAHSAYKDFETPGDAMREFEKVTGQKVSDEGCNCCGAPHNFYWGRAAAETDQEAKELEREEYGYAGGEGCLEYLFEGKKIPRNLREALESADKGNPRRRAKV